MGGAGFGSIFIAAQALGMAVILLALHGAAQGGTYYVDQNAPNASDGNAGSEGAPWKTIGRAAAAEEGKPGDTVLIHSGVYREHVQVTVVVEGCKIYQSDFCGLGLGRSRDCVVRDCDLSYNGNTGLGMGECQDCLIEGCTLIANNYRRFHSGWHAGGMKCIPKNVRCTVRDCDQHGTRFVLRTHEGMDGTGVLPDQVRSIVPPVPRSGCRRTEWLAGR